MTATTKTSSVAVLGAGSWGTVVATLAAKNCSQVFLFDHNQKRATEIQERRESPFYLPGAKLPSEIHITSDLALALANAKVVFIVVPSSAMRALAQKIASLVQGDHLLIHGTKGLEPGSFKRMSEILIEETNCLRVGALSGPNLAAEIAEGKHAASVVASRFDEVIDAAQTALSSNTMQIFGNHDLVGVEWAGALKNILAIVSGMIDELNYGQNANAMILTRGLVEMSELISAVGAKSSTLVGLAGIGDMLATAMSHLSRNYRAGQLIARGKSLDETKEQLGVTAEGLNTIAVAAELARLKRIEAPITFALEKIVYKKTTVHEALSHLMDRPKRLENFRYNNES